MSTLWSKITGERFDLQQSPVYTKARKRLETVSSEEVFRYIDNVHSSQGSSIQVMRKILASGNTDKDLMDDIRNASELMKAAVDVLELRG